MSWQPIETVPKGGPVLVYCPDAREPNICIATLNDFTCMETGETVTDWTDEWLEEGLDVEPTHWQHLPAKPNSINPTTSGVSMTWPQYRRCECTVHGHKVQLTPSLATLLSVLLLRRGQFVSRNDLTCALYPDPWSSPECETDVMRNLLFKLNHRIGRLIINNHTLGWMIELPRELAEAA